jgi:S-adenosylmethionine-diacylglycerol 3-amino-3-carboxypropyl transferase
MSSEGMPDWVIEARKFPLAFAQVREDPLIDLAVVEGLGEDVEVAMVASGGCTAALLATSSNLKRIHLIDPNPTQLALSRYKLRLLQTREPGARLAFLGHASMPADERRELLQSDMATLGFEPEVFGPAAVVAELGPDNVGRYEFTFAALREALSDCEEEINEVLALRDPLQRTQLMEPSVPLGRRLDEALDEVMSLPNLVQLFGEEATNNPVEPFSRHFAGRIRNALAAFPSDRNPYLWQMLKGRYPTDWVSPWLYEPEPLHLPRITWSIGFMTEELESRPAFFDFVHLSNILDWLTPDQARKTLEVAWNALRPGGRVLIRQLNSSLEIRALGSRFEWLVDEASDLHAKDRSFFYRELHLGKKA